ncbi:hypothetical protein L2E82_48757 [Cichorium intybus]|uniref:Uncharacterized protein n=1 Tax=Cichorium intybus TaxID=13427 RepID=A0ACB8YYS6_CICIN|nr:hypothetical protein L2E82_48757 [Cichorium intybus]
MERRYSVGRGSWKDAGFHLAATIATPATYAPLPFVVSSLGWPLGTVFDVYKLCLKYLLVVNLDWIYADKIFNGVFLKVNKATLNMLHRMEPYVTYGYPNLKIVKELIYKRGYGKLNKQRIPLTDNSIVEQVIAGSFFADAKKPKSSGVPSPAALPNMLTFGGGAFLSQL